MRIRGQETALVFEWLCYIKRSAIVISKSR